MRTFQLVLLSALAASSVPGWAASEAPPGPGLTRQAAAMSAAADTYTIADGHQLRLVYHGERLYAELIRRQPVELFQVAENVFATRDSSLRIEIKPGADAYKEVVVQDLAPTERPVRRWRLI